MTTHELARLLLAGPDQPVDRSSINRLMRRADSELPARDPLEQTNPSPSEREWVQERMDRIKAAKIAKYASGDLTSLTHEEMVRATEQTA